MSAATMAYAAQLVPGEHEIRPPGEQDWLLVESVDPRTNDERFPSRTFLVAGGREFVTERSTLWPARMAGADQ